MKLRDFMRWAWQPRFISSKSHDLWLNLKFHRGRDAFSSIYQRIRPYTLCSPSCLQSLYEGVRYVTSRNIPGDIVECGIARGGSTALMASALVSLNGKAARRVWGYDSFEGMPEPTTANADWKIAREYSGQCRGSLPEVRALLNKLGILEHCELVPGLFAETLGRRKPERIALLHLDCDWYESVTECLEALYDSVSAGGIIQIDDYGHWQGARHAVDTFLAKQPGPIALQRIDYSGRRFMKPITIAEGQPCRS